MLTRTPQEWSSLFGGELLQCGTREITGFSVDSRTTQNGDMFLALAGRQTNGHQFLSDAIANGAAALLVQTMNIPLPSDITVIRVSDTMAALTNAAKSVLDTIAPCTIAITGSVGKTTTKGLLCAILSQQHATFATPGNYNTEIGVPLAILTMPTDTRYFLCECGMRGAGEIQHLATLLQPNIGIITCIGTSHLELLGSRAAIANAKMELTTGIKPNGTLIYDGEEPLLSPCRKRSGLRAIPVLRNRLYTLGIHEDYTNFSYMGKSYRAPLFGDALLYDAAIAITTARHLGFSEKEIQTGLSAYHAATGRQELLHPTADITILFDGYNAAPESMYAAIETLTALPAKRRIAVLGDMLELGKESVELHYALGTLIAAKGISLLFCIGKDAAWIAKGASCGGMNKAAVVLFDNHCDFESISDEIASVLCAGDLLLLKASHALGFEKLTDLLTKKIKKGVR